MNGWFCVGSPDNPMSIQIRAISHIVKVDMGCKIVTIDGTNHHFYAVSYEDMMCKFGVDKDDLRI